MRLCSVRQAYSAFFASASTIVVRAAQSGCTEEARTSFLQKPRLSTNECTYLYAKETREHWMAEP